MGNIGSQIGHINHRSNSGDQWNQSFPKTQNLYQNKVLPERDVHQKLRHTSNGEILHSGGTLTGRHENNRYSLQDPDFRPQRTYMANQRNPLHKSGNRYTQTMEYKSLDSQQNMKKFGSEPDLRQLNGLEMQERERRRKKYKAPSPPQPETRDSSLEFEENFVRRPRLFKTQAESKKYSSPVHEHKNLDKHRSNRLSLPEITAPNFQQELKEVTERLRQTKTSDKLKTLDYNLHKKDNNVVRQKLKAMEVDEKPPQKDELKTFYFGMNEKLSMDDYHNNVVNQFASNLHQPQKIVSSSESDISSEMELDEATTMKEGINLQLRPILPKKQLEIPRFSPVAAWRLLLAMETDPTGSTIASDDLPIFLEERIEKCARSPPPTIQIDPRSNNDKSGDSGISGDAGPTGYDDGGDERSGNQILMPRNPETSWTPQQDLGDDSSLEEGLNESNYNKHSNKPHVFSLSLPRDNHFPNCTSYTSLQKLKQSMSGVLANISSKKEVEVGNTSQDQSDNWFLSKSAPNSLNNGFSSLEMRVSSKSDQPELLGASGRLMYLPEFNNVQDHRHMRSKSRDSLRERSKSAERLTSNYRISSFSKSCENISKYEPEDLQDPPRVAVVQNGKKSKRFTFQSTVRQIERRRVAEKLSIEAEKKEKQRLRELEAMQRVEEEFQKKRAKEKANIRQQLRLFSIDDVGCVSLPPNLEQVRHEPDGAVSSTVSSEKIYQKNSTYRASSDSSDDTKIKAHVTQVLSEYRHPHREYKEYTGSSRYLNEQNDSSHTKTTVHPQVTYNMPKSKQGVGNNATSTNYRKEFVHGLKSTRYAGSNFSEESQSKNNSPRLYSNKYAPITRF